MRSLPLIVCGVVLVATPTAALACGNSIHRTKEAFRFEVATPAEDWAVRYAWWHIRRGEHVDARRVLLKKFPHLDPWTTDPSKWLLREPSGVLLALAVATLRQSDNTPWATAVLKLLVNAGMSEARGHYAEALARNPLKRAVARGILEDVEESTALSDPVLILLLRDLLRQDEGRS